MEPTIERLRPFNPEHKPLPQCSSKVTMTNVWFRTGYWENRVASCKKRGEDPYLCTKRGIVKINGKPYCAQHGGAIAINILLGEKNETGT